MNGSRLYVPCSRSQATTWINRYAPVTVLIDQRPDGVHLSYDEMEGLIAPYGNAEVLKIAHDLDTKVKKLLEDAS